MLSQIGHRRNMPLTRLSLFLRPRTLIDPAAPTVVTDPRHIALVHHVCVVHVVNHSDVHVVHRAIVEKLPTLPTPTFISVAEVSIAIVNATIKSHHRPPETFVKHESAAAPGPIPWSPQK